MNQGFLRLTPALKTLACESRLNDENVLSET